MINASAITLLAATNPGRSLASLVIEGVELSVVGMGIVFVALIAIMLMLQILQRAGRNQAPEAKINHVPMDTVGSSPAIAVAEEESGDPSLLPDELVVLLTAAAIAAVGSPVRLKSVRLANTSQHTAWSESGRRDVHTSHRLRKRDS